MNESGLQTQEREWLYWQAFEIAHRLFNDVPTNFNEFVLKLDRTFGEKNEQS